MPGKRLGVGSGSKHPAMAVPAALPSPTTAQHHTLLLHCHARLPARPIAPQVTAPDGRRLVTCKGAPQIIGDLLHSPEEREAVDRWAGAAGCAASVKAPRKDTCWPVSIQQGLGTQHSHACTPLSLPSLHHPCLW